MNKLFLVFIILFGTLTAAQSKHELSYKLAPKQIYSFEQAADFSLNFEVPDLGINKVSGIVDTNLRLEILSVDKDGNASAKATIEKFACHFSAPPLGKIEINTHKPKSLEFLNFVINIDVLVGKNLTLTFTPKGRVTKVEGVDELIDSLLGFCDQLDPNYKLFVAPMVKEQFNEKILCKNFENSLAIFPKVPVAIGESWTFDTKLPGEEVFDYQIISTLVKPGEIKQEHIIKSNENSEMNHCFKGDGTLIYDIHTGMLKQGTLTLKGDLNSPMIPSETQMTFTANVITKATPVE